MTKATIYECGNGLPDVGDYVTAPGAYPDLWRIVSIDSGIQTRQWEANHIRATVEPADWDDLTDEQADDIACRATIDGYDIDGEAQQ